MLDLSQIADVNMRLTTPEDMHLQTFDFTKLNAISECALWGILRYGHHKVISGTGRAMALEAGSAMHEVFAAIRLIELYRGGLHKHVEFHGTRLFGESRFESMAAYLGAGEEDRTNELNFALEALNTGGFYDDPRDKRRTLANLEECAIGYYDDWCLNDRIKSVVYVEDEGDETKFVGIELPVDFVIEFIPKDNNSAPIVIRYTGRVDGLHKHKGNKLFAHENKTASRLDSSWSQGMQMSHQITGYTMYMSLFTGSVVDNAIVHGLAIPLPRSYGYGGIVREPTTRPQFKVKSWLRWVLNKVQIHNEYFDKVLEAPQETRACNRYFRPCNFVPLCDVPEEDKDEILDLMVLDEWSPLKENN